jgi:hypothetical protein
MNEHPDFGGLELEIVDLRSGPLLPLAKDRLS